MTLRDDVIECMCQIPALIDIYPQRFGNAPGRFVEVGSFNGLNWSNVYPLVNLGWSGLMFEPYPEFYETCRDRYFSNALIQVEQCAIADKCGEVKLFPGGSMTTIEEDLISIWNQNEVLRTQGLSVDNFIACEAHTLDCRLNERDWPHEFELLSIDTEGADYRVLMGLDLKVYRPKMIIVELDIESQEPIISERVKWVQAHLLEAGYERIYNDMINSIYWQVT